MSESGDRQRDGAYWLSRTPEERLAEVERLRREAFGPGYDDVRMEKVTHLLRGGRTIWVRRVEDFD